MNYCPHLTSLLKDACACASQMSHQVIQDCVWQNTEKERAQYQNYPKSEALAYLHHGSDYRTAMPVVVCPQKGGLKDNGPILMKYNQFPPLLREEAGEQRGGV